MIQRLSYSRIGPGKFILSSPGWKNAIIRSCGGRMASTTFFSAGRFTGNKTRVPHYTCLSTILLKSDTCATGVTQATSATYNAPVANDENNEYGYIFRPSYIDTGDTDSVSPG